MHEEIRKQFDYWVANSAAASYGHSLAREAGLPEELRLKYAVIILAAENARLMEELKTKAFGVTRFVGTIGTCREIQALKQAVVTEGSKK